MGWTNDERLICIQDNSIVFMYDIYGEFLSKFCISEEAKDMKIIDAKIFTNPQNFTGIAVMTSSHKIFFVNNILEAKERMMPELQSNNSLFIVINSVLADVYRIYNSTNMLVCYLAGKGNRNYCC